MTVQELIEELKKMPPETIVVADGADCGGYDVEMGYNVSATYQQLVTEERFPNSPFVCYISHDGSADSCSVYDWERAGFPIPPPAVRTGERK